jgi:hypothetical protein
MSRYNENEKVLPILAPQDIAATATATSYVNAKNAVGLIQIDFRFGNIASTDSTGEAIVTVQASTASSSNATELAIAFKYRKSSAVDTDAQNTITDATTDGIGMVSSSDDNSILSVFVDPAALAAAGADYSFLRGVISPTTDVTATLVGVEARFTPSYAGNAIPSAT